MCSRCCLFSTLAVSTFRTTPALQHGATVTIHPRFTPDAALTAIERDRPTLTVLVPATIQALTDHPD